MSSLPLNLGWTKLLREKAGWRGEEGKLLMEGSARNVFEAEHCVYHFFLREGVVEGMVVATSLLWPGYPTTAKASRSLAGQVAHLVPINIF